MTGRLSIVATPIGNLDDITLRALRVLRECEAILAEDTRRTRGLCTHHGIETRLVSFHAHTTDAKRRALVEELSAGKRYALVTDAGSPLVSDPGYELLRDATEAGVEVECIPGPSAVVTALTVAALPSDTFRFVGFLPRSGGRRKRALAAIARDESAVVLFEAPNRLVDTLSELATVLGDRRIAVCRELTKLHEEVTRGTALELVARHEAGVRGEITIVIEALPAGTLEEAPTETDPEALAMRARALRAEGLPPKAVAKALAELSGLSTKDAYRLVVTALEADGD